MSIQSNKQKLFHTIVGGNNKVNGNGVWGSKTTDIISRLLFLEQGRTYIYKVDLQTYSCFQGKILHQCAE
jgi:hypothetical protein